MLPPPHRNTPAPTQNFGGRDLDDENNHEALTRTATPEVDCQLRSHLLRPSHSERMWARRRPEIAAACEARDQRRVQGLLPWGTGCLWSVSGDEWGWMNVQCVPFRIHPVRPPSWTRVMEPVTSLPGLKLPGRNCSPTVPAQHHLVRPGP